MNRSEGNGYSPEETGSIRRKNIALQFQARIGEMRAQTLLPEPEKNIYLEIPLLDTNERFSEDQKRRIRESTNPPNGYIIGGGFGNIFHMLETFPEQATPIALITTDIRADIVLGGRAAILEGSKKGGDIYTFFDNLTERTESVVDEVIAREPDTAFRNRFLRSKREAVFKLNTLRPLLSHERRESLPGKRVIDVLEDNFETFQQLAQEGNIGITLCDITNPVWINEVSKLPGFSQSNNVIYLSNIMDHLTDYGRFPRRYNRFEGLKVFGEGEARGNLFVDTLQALPHHYQLRVSHTVPKFTKADFRGS